MSNDGGPWAHMKPDPEPKAPAPRAGPAARVRIAWPVVVLALGIGGLILALRRAFPEARPETQQMGDAVYLAGFVLLMAAGLWRARQLAPLQIVRHGAVWVAIAAVLALGFAYRDDLMGVPQHLAIAFGGGRPVATGPHQLVVSEDADGAFMVVGQVNGQPVRFMIDTGASDTVLAPQDAQRLGVDPASLKYDHFTETANGTGHGARFVAQSLEVGPIRLSDVPMEINQAPMSTSLLGLSFLKQMDSVEVRGRNLYLKWGGE
jgi:aspartyl protease family protein